MRVAKAVTFLRTYSLRQVFNRLKAETYHKDTLVRHSPCCLSFDVSRVCNMNCPFCSTKKYRGENNSELLSLSKAKIFLDKFNSAYFVGLCGTGEPFLNPDLFAIARYAIQLRMKVRITTNGTVLYRRMDELLASNIYSLEISLKGINGEDYARFTGRKESEFCLIIASVKELSKCRNRPKLIMSYVCDRKRVYNIPQVVKIAEECKVDEMTFQNLIPNTVLKNESDCLYEDDKQWVLKLLNGSLRESCRIVVDGPTFYCRDSTRRNCTVPFRTLRIRADGGVSGCDRAIAPNLENGNALTDNDVFNNEHFRKLRDELINNNIPLRYECLYCDVRCM